MPWFKLDQGFHSHPKIIAAGNEAIGLYVRCGAYAAEHLTDGFVPESIALLYGSGALADTLVKTKLWRRTRGGWRMPDYLDYNPSKEVVDKERKAAAERQRRRREALMSQRDSQRDSQPPVPDRTDFKNGSVVTGTDRGLSTSQRKPDLASQNGAATRQPPPYADAVAKALNPEPWDAFRKDQP